MDTYKSTTGYLYMMCGGPIAWKSKRQSTVALSSCEAEILALTLGTQTAVWLRKLIKETFNETVCIRIHEDNQSAITITNGGARYSARTRHFGVRHFFARELVEQGQIRLTYCQTAEMLADILTKALGGPTHNRLCTLMHLEKEGQANGGLSEGEPGLE